MHLNPAYRRADTTRNIAFARARGFGSLVVNGPDGILMSHVPFLLSDDATTLDLHLMRPNPILRALATPQPVLLAVTGPDSYISPDWYGVPDQVPTWNYVAVHLRGTLARLPEDDMRDMLDRQSAAMEANHLPKTPWTTDKMTPEPLARMMRQILPCRMTIEDVQGTWKLNQNKPDAVRLRAADHVETSGHGSEVQTLATLMRNPPE